MGSESGSVRGQSHVDIILLMDAVVMAVEEVLVVVVEEAVVVVVVEAVVVVEELVDADVLVVAFRIIPCEPSNILSLFAVE